MNNSQPIGVFDSGVGGLTVLKNITKKLPNEDYIYYGDNLHLPYGDKTKEEIVFYTKKILDWYKTLNPKAVLIACNTSSALALEELRDDYEFPIFGTIKPTVKSISTLEESNIGVIATAATVNSHSYKKEIAELSPEKKVFEISCPGLVELVESDKIHLPETKIKIKACIAPLLNENVDKIVLGCTHYPFLSKIIEELTEKEGVLIDPAEFITNEAVEFISKNKNPQAKGSIKFATSKDVESFYSQGKKLFPELENVELINIFE